WRKSRPMAEQRLSDVTANDQFENRQMGESWSSTLGWLLSPEITTQLHEAEVLALSSSLTVNPWQEVITPLIGTGGLAGAGLMAIKNADAVLNFFLRVSTFREERRTRISQLRQDAIREQCDTVVKLVDDLKDPIPLHRRLAAAELLSTALLLSPQLPQGRTQQITVDEVAARRRELLEITQPDHPDDRQP
ncbi:hypothetical protein ACW9HQ_36890, partial [Nocardia gipuzkoensis]